MPWKQGNRLPVVAESAANESTRRVYGEVKQALGEPTLSLFYSALGAYPEFLQMHWRLFGPLARSQELLAMAGRLRADAYTRAHGYLRIPDLRSRLQELTSSETAPQELTAKLEMYHCREAALLLLFSAQMQALDGPVGRNFQPTPAEPPEFAHEMPIAEAENESVRRICREIRRGLQLPYLNSEYQALARWPEFLSAYWDVLKDLVQSPLYRECHYGVRETAWVLARELPGPIEMSLDQLTEAAMTQADVASVGRILELFVKNLSGLGLNMAIAKISLEGGNQQMKEAAKPCKPGRAA